MSFEGLNDGNGHTISARDRPLPEALLNVASQTGGDGAAGGGRTRWCLTFDPIAARSATRSRSTFRQREPRVLGRHPRPAGTAAGKYNRHPARAGRRDAGRARRADRVGLRGALDLHAALGLRHGLEGPAWARRRRLQGRRLRFQLRARYVQAALDNHISLHQPYFTSTVDASGNEKLGHLDQYVAPFLDGTRIRACAGEG